MIGRRAGKLCHILALAAPAAAPGLVVLAVLAGRGDARPAAGADRRRRDPGADRDRDRPLRPRRRRGARCGRRDCRAEALERGAATPAGARPEPCRGPGPADHPAAGARLARAGRECASAPRRGRGDYRRRPRSADPARRTAADRPRQRRRRRICRRAVAAARSRRGIAQSGGAGGGRRGVARRGRARRRVHPDHSGRAPAARPLCPHRAGVARRRCRRADPARHHRIEARRADARRLHRQCEPRAAHAARHPDRLYRDPARAGARRRRSPRAVSRRS